MWIQNVSLADIVRGYHYDAGPNSMLIQIVDPDMEFPEPACKFAEVYQFKFLDIEEYDHSSAITDHQARQIAQLLQQAVDKRMNVVVHCHAGVCRGGAVCEVGVILGLQDTEGYRNPNLLVKHKLLRALGIART
jgi:predicted protein tyrosine phosphatase